MLTVWCCFQTTLLEIRYLLYLFKDKIKTAKFVDLDFNKINDRVVTDPNCRTDTKRMFAAGSGTSMEFFFTRDRVTLQIFRYN